MNNIDNIDNLDNLDPKCLVCKYFFHAPALQIWCDKLGICKKMPTKACKYYIKRIKRKSR